MRKVIKSPSVLLEGTERPINVTKNSGCYLEILSAISSQMNAILSRHSKLAVIRLDINTGQKQTNNSEISRLVKKIKRRCRSWYGADFGYTWAHEANGQHHHYHIANFLNGNRCNSGWRIHDWVSQRAQSYGWPPPHHSCSRKTFTVSRGSVNGFNQAFYAVSYLAKERSKDGSVHAHNYGASHLRVTHLVSATEA